MVLGEVEEVEDDVRVHDLGHVDNIVVFEIWDGADALDKVAERAARRPGKVRHREVAADTRRLKIGPRIHFFAKPLLLRSGYRYFHTVDAFLIQ